MSSKKRGPKPSHNNDNLLDDDKDDRPTWDTSDKLCRPFHRDLRQNDWLYSQVHGARTLVERGYIRYKGGKILMPTPDMVVQYKAGTLPVYSFEAPSPVAPPSGAPSAAPSTPSSTAPSGSAPASAPGASTAAPTISSTTSSLSSPMEAHLFAVDEDSCVDVDRAICREICGCITNKVYAEQLAQDHRHSGREILRWLAEKAKVLSRKSSKSTAAIMKDLRESGLVSPKVAAFNEFTSEYGQLNGLLKKPESDDDLIEVYVDAASNLSDLFAHTLKSELREKEREVQRSHGRSTTLAETISVITSELADYEEELTAKARVGRGLSARDASKNRTAPRSDTRPEWTIDQGLCRHKATTGCDGQHWNSQCPNREAAVAKEAAEKAAVKAKAKTDKKSYKASAKAAQGNSKELEGLMAAAKAATEAATEATKAMAAQAAPAGSAKMARTPGADARESDEQFAAAFFSGGGKTTSLDEVADSSSLLSALVDADKSAAPAGRHLCAMPTCSTTTAATAATTAAAQTKLREDAPQPDDDDDEDSSSDGSSVSSEASDNQASLQVQPDSDEEIDDPVARRELESALYLSRQKLLAKKELERLHRETPSSHGPPPGTQPAGRTQASQASRSPSPVYSSSEDEDGDTSNAGGDGVDAAPDPHGYDASTARRKFYVIFAGGDSHAGIYFGTWHSPDNVKLLAEHRPAPPHCPTSRAASGVGVAITLCTNHGIAPIFRGPIMPPAEVFQTVGAGNVRIGDDLRAPPPPAPVPPAAPPIVPLPPVLLSPTHPARVGLRSALCSLYQHSFYSTTGNSMPPNMTDLRAGGKGNAFAHRTVPAELVPRGLSSKVCLYTRTYLVGTGEYAVARAEHPPGGGAEMLAALAAAQAATAHLLTHVADVSAVDEDSIFASAAPVLVADFTEARAAALANPLHEAPASARVLGYTTVSHSSHQIVTTATACLSMAQAAMLIVVLAMLVRTLDFGALPHLDPLTNITSTLLIVSVAHAPLARLFVSQGKRTLGRTPRRPPPISLAIASMATTLLLLLFRHLVVRSLQVAARLFRCAIHALFPAVAIVHLGMRALAITAACGWAAGSPRWRAARLGLRHVAESCVAHRRVAQASRMAAATLIALVFFCNSALFDVTRSPHRICLSRALLAAAVVYARVARGMGGSATTLENLLDRYLLPQARIRRTAAHARRDRLRTRRRLSIKPARRHHEPPTELGCSRRRHHTLRRRPENDPCADACANAERPRLRSTLRRRPENDSCADACANAERPRLRSRRSRHGRCCMSHCRAPEKTIYTKCHVAAFKAQGTTPTGTVLKLVMDSGCTWHCHPVRIDLINFKPRKENMVGIDGTSCAVEGIGDLPILVKDKHGASHSLLIKNVRHVPDFTDTLLSVEQFYSESKVEVRFANHRKVYLPKDSQGDKTSFPFEHYDGLYIWRAVSILRLKGQHAATGRTLTASRGLSKVEQAHGARTSSHLGAISGRDAAETLHRRLHLGHDLIRKLPERTIDAPSNVASPDARPHSCPSCLEANVTKMAHKQPRYKPSYPGRLVHADIVGPFKRSTIGSYCYLLVLVDDHSRYISVHPLRAKSEAPAAIRSFVASMQSSLSKGQSTPTRFVGTLHTDNAGEFLSRDFTEFLDDELIAHTTCPPYVHELNGVAERAIRSVVEIMRSNIVASALPVGFWEYAASHAADVLNRCTCPPGSSKTCFEMLTGSKPKILDIWPLGCRGYAVKPRHTYSKTNIETHGWRGMNLGKVPSIPGAYHMWLEDAHKVVHASEVFFDETLMPWRPRDDQRVGLPAPHAAGDVDSPDPLGTAAPPTVPDRDPVETHDSLTKAYEKISDKCTKALDSKRVLILFSGPKRRPDGLAAFLEKLGFTAECVDILPSTAELQDSEDLLDKVVFDRLLRAAASGQYGAIIAAPPCSTFSVSRFIVPTDGKSGAPPVRDRTHIEGLPSLPADLSRQVHEANLLLRRTVAILAAGHAAGAQFLLENPADRGKLSEADLFLHEKHAPLWLMSEVKALQRVTNSEVATFPMCAFGSDWQKFTSIMYSPGFTSWLRPLERLRCHHYSHRAPAGGETDENGLWVSAAAAAYPADLNYYLARAVASLRSPATAPVVKVEKESTRGRGTQLSKTSLSLEDGDEDDLPPPSLLTEATHSLARHSPRASNLSPARQPAFGDSDEPPADAPPSAKPQKQARRVTWQREGEELRRVTRQGRRAGSESAAPGSALMAGSSWRFGRPAVGRSLLAKRAQGDPRNHPEAMSADREGWTVSELKELQNHVDNGSFRRVDRSTIDRKKLVKLTWAYKTKRDGSKKSRLCVQGCSQIPGVDYDQTFCGAMRATTLRLLCSTATRLGLRMRRYDFVSAYLQGDLLDGEVVYCSPPPGHETRGTDGLPQVYVVQKPIYGMAQAGRRWQRSLYPWLLDWRSSKKGGSQFQQLHSDSNVFICHALNTLPDGSTRDEWLMLGCYVDDLFTLYSHDDEHSLYRRFIKDLDARWAVEDEGEVSDLLGVEIASEGNVVSLKQTSYIEKMAKNHFGDDIPPDCKGFNVPYIFEGSTATLAQVIADALSDDRVRRPEEIKAYQSIVGALLYAATHTRPDVAYAVGMLCRAMGSPSPDTMLAARHVLAYLYYSRHIGLRYERDHRPLSGKTDSDWAVKHSTSGFVFHYNQAAVSWGSSKQKSVALSSCEAEIMAASEAAKEALYLRNFLIELGVATDAPIDLATDNTAARDLSYNPEHHQRVKHIERRHFFVRECVENMQLNVPFVRTADNWADMFTKALHVRMFVPLRDAIMNVSPDDRMHGGALASDTASATGGS